MATIVNNPGDGNSSGSAAVWVIGLIVIVLLIIAAFYFIPRLNGSQGTTSATTAQQSNGQTGVPTTVNNTTINASSTVNLATSTP